MATWKGHRLTKNCLVCGVVFTTPISNNNKYCSQKCYWKTLENKTPWNKGKRGFLGGNQHYNWKGGITSKDVLERKRFRHELQKTVFERDNYTCQLCNQKGGYLQVDHIQEWSKFIEGRFNIKNCRTLCMACHYKITYKKSMPKTTKIWGHNLLQGGTENV